ncbi:MAG: GNVR domain-containing protein [Candidatus Omnitrophota bacterium]
MENQETAKVTHPLEYLKIFFRRKWTVIYPAFIGLVLGIVAAFVMPPRYEAYTLILVEEEKIINPLIQDLAVSTSAIQRMQTIKEMLLGWNSLVELTKKLDLAKNIQTQQQFENLILGLRKNISVQMRGPSSHAQNMPTIIRISYFGDEPRQTQRITQTLSDNLVDENMRTQTKETDVAIEFIKEQLDVYKRKIKESEVSDLEEQLKNLLVDSTEQHPLVRELRQKLDIAKKELESGEFKVATAPLKDDPAYKALQQELDKVISQETTSGGAAYLGVDNGATDPNAAIYKLMLMDKYDSVLARDKNVNENIYNMLLQKLETAKITQRLEASRQGTRYTVIDPPRLPYRPAKPNKAMIIFMGLLLGAGVGVGLVLAGEFLDQSILDIADAKDNLKFPVLGGISRITTQEEIDKEKNWRKKLAIVVSLSSLALIIAALLFSFVRR